MSARVIALPRRGGKTTALLEWLREPTDPDEVRVFVAHTRHEAMAMLRQEYKDAERTGRPPLESWRFVSYDEATRPGCWAAIRGTIVIGIDNADIILETILRRPVAALTCTEATP